MWRPRFQVLLIPVRPQLLIDRVRFQTNTFQQGIRDAAEDLSGKSLDCTLARSSLWSLEPRQEPFFGPGRIGCNQDNKAGDNGAKETDNGHK